MTSNGGSPAGSRSASANDDRVGHARARPRSPGPDRGRRASSRPPGSRPRGASAAAAARPPARSRWRPSRCPRRRRAAAACPAGRGADVSRQAISRSASATSSSVSGRGISARAVHAEGQAVELLEAADVGHRLAGLAPDERPLRTRPRRPRRPAPRDGRSAPSAPRRWPSPAAARRRGARSPTRRRGGVPCRSSGARRSSPCRCSPLPPRPAARGHRRHRVRPLAEQPQQLGLVAWSLRASISLSMSPSMTPGRLCRSRPMRWSVSRSWGKL